MDYMKQAEYEVGYLDMDINTYVAQIIPMLLPLDATKEEKEKLERILFQTTALSVYNLKEDELFEKFFQIRADGNIRTYGNELRKQSEAEVIKIWNELEKTKPYMPYRYKLLRRSKNSRYIEPKEWHDKNPELSACDSRRLVKEYTKRTWSKVSLKNVMDFSEEQIQIRMIFALRDFFHNGGQLEDVDLDSPEFKSLEDAVKSMHEDLVQKVANLKSFEQSRYLRFPYLFSEKNKMAKDKVYIDGCESARQFADANKLLAYKKSAEKSAQARNDKKYTKEEYANLSRLVIDLFDKEFSTLPINEEEHKARLEKIFGKISTVLSTRYSMQRTNIEQYQQLMQDTYNKYMEQLKTQELPLRLSYFPEDKVAYSRIIKEAREAQRRERLYGKPTHIDVGRALAFSTLAIGAVFAGMEAISVGNYVIPAAEVSLALGAYVSNRLCEHKRLVTDVSTRPDIQDKRIADIKGYKPSSITRKRYVKQQSLPNEEEIDGIKIEYCEVQKNPEATIANKPYVRNRRSDKYKTEKTTEAVDNSTSYQTSSNYVRKPRSQRHDKLEEI